MSTLDDWRRAVAEAAGELRQCSDVIAPPVDAIQIAQSARLAIAMDRTQIGRGRIKRIAGQPTIFLRPEERPERWQWAVAHELGESQTGRICRSLSLDPGDLLPREREELANQVAREILLPLDWFRRDCESLDYDLVQLKARYRTASHELIAWRWLDLETPAFVSIFDQGVLTRRRGNGPISRRKLTEIEREFWKQLRRTRQPATLSDRELMVRGWCIDSLDWQREILLALVQHEMEEAASDVDW